VPVPAIVTKEVWEKANRRVAFNKPIATRNNKTSKESLLRGGFVRCAYCGQALHPVPKSYPLVSGERAVKLHYQCSRPYLRGGKCTGCSISVELLDNAAIAYINKLIRDPSKVDTAIQELLKENPLKKRQQKALKDLNKILAEQASLRANLSREMKKKNLSEETVALLGRDLKDLEQQEKEARDDLANQQQVQQQYEDLDRRIAEFHQQCQEWREKLDTPEFQPDFHFYQEAVIFFGITVKVWRKGTEPPYEFHPRPPAIVELLSLNVCISSLPPKTVL
jgi:ribosomal protein L34E